MDRFIGSIGSVVSNIWDFLKSNMDRFIVDVGVKKLATLSDFKIQYG